MDNKEEHQFVKKAIRILNDGGIIIYPTDTAFGIGCRIDKQSAVDRLFLLRKRAISQAMPVLVSSQSMALTYYKSASNIVRHLMKTYWPGALTIVYYCNEDKIYSPIRGNGHTVGLRMPNYKPILEIIEEVRVPILGSSANFHGYKTPFTLDELDKNLVKQVDFVLPGDTQNKGVSTVVDCTTTPYSIIRQGVVKIT